MSILEFFHQLDLAVLYHINLAWSNPVLDKVMGYVSDFDTWRPYLVGAVITAIFLGRFRVRLFLVMMLACLLIGDAGINWALKKVVNRPRPNETEYHLRCVTPREITESDPRYVRDGHSFTSGHACNNLALALVATAIFGRAAWVLWPWAFLVGYSRVYCASHYPSDVVGSWIVAAFYTYFILKAADGLWRNYAPRQFPSIYLQHPVFFPSLFPAPDKTRGTAAPWRSRDLPSSSSP